MCYNVVKSSNVRTVYTEDKMDDKNTIYIDLNTKPLDNKTYVECHDNHEENTDERTKHFADLWKTTNLWLGIIGIYFLGKIVIGAIKAIIAIQLGQDILSIFSATFG